MQGIWKDTKKNFTKDKSKWQLKHPELLLPKQIPFKWDFVDYPLEILEAKVFLNEAHTKWELYNLLVYKRNWRHISYYQYYFIDNQQVSTKFYWRYFAYDFELTFKPLKSQKFTTVLYNYYMYGNTCIGTTIRIGNRTQYERIKYAYNRPKSKKRLNNYLESNYYYIP